MKKGIWRNIFAVIALVGILYVSGCTTASSSGMYYYQAPSRPMLSSQERENLTEANIALILQRGDEEYAKGNYSVAKDLYYETLLATSDPDVSVLVSYGSSLANLGLYENAVTIFTIVLEKDPDNEIAKENTEICRQLIARQTEEQRQLRLEQQRLQRENMQNLVAALSSLTEFALENHDRQNSSITADDNNSSGAHGGNQASSSAASSSGGRNAYDSARAGRDYANYEKTAKNSFENIIGGNDYSGQSRRAFLNAQARMRAIRTEAAKNGHTIRQSDWETARLPN